MKTSEKLYKWAKTLNLLAIVGAVLFLVYGFLVIFAKAGLSFSALFGAIAEHPGVFFMRYMERWSWHPIAAVVTFVLVKTFARIVEGLAKMTEEKDA